MSKNNNFIGLEEIHIVKREDGEGFKLEAKGIFNGEPSTIDIPKLKQPYISIDQKYDQKHEKSEYLYANLYQYSLSFSAELLPENEIYCSITIDPKYYAAKQLEKLEAELVSIKKESEDSINAIKNKISEIKKSL